MERKVLITGIFGQELISVSTPIPLKRLGALRTVIVLGGPFVCPSSYGAGQTKRSDFSRKLSHRQ